jgi:hypothetical protein
VGGGERASPRAEAGQGRGTPTGGKDTKGSGGKADRWGGKGTQIMFRWTEEQAAPLGFVRAPGGGASRRSLAVRAAARHVIGKGARERAGGRVGIDLAGVAGGVLPGPGALVERNGEGLAVWRVEWAMGVSASRGARVVGRGRRAAMNARRGRGERAKAAGAAERRSRRALSSSLGAGALSPGSIDRTQTKTKRAALSPKHATLHLPNKRHRAPTSNDTAKPSLPRRSRKKRELSPPLPPPPPPASPQKNPLRVTTRAH